MQPVFTMQYGEFAVAEYLSSNIKDSSVFIPCSAQEKGIDLLLYRYKDNHNMTNTMQVKMSRSYKNNKWHYSLWFNRFDVPKNADWIILVGIYAKTPENINAKTKETKWDTVMLAFTNEEMTQFMSEVKQKKDPSKDDRMFGFWYDENGNIYQERGCVSNRKMSKYLIEKRIAEISSSLKQNRSRLP